MQERLSFKRSNSLWAAFALTAASLWLSGCGCSVTQSKYVFVNQTGAVAVVKVDGGATFRSYAPGQSDSYCLERSTPHALVVTYHAMTPFGLSPPMGMDSKTLTWDANAGWREGRGGQSVPQPVSEQLPLDE